MVCYFALPQKNQEEAYYLLKQLQMHLIFKKKIYTYDKIILVSINFLDYDILYQYVNVTVI